MKPELQKKLVEKYPELFIEWKRNLAPKQPIGQRGIECGDGWYDILDRMSKEIQSFCDETKTELWYAQIKEKFAELRVYYDFKDLYTVSNENKELLSKIIHKYVDESNITCEDCGSKGNDVEKRKGGWVRTLCNSCYEKFMKE